MSEAVRIKRNSMFSLLTNITRLLSNVLIFVGIARLYGPESLGQFTTAQTFATLFLIFADFGFDTLLATEVARERARGELLASRYLSLKLLTAGGSSTLMLLVPLLHPMSPSTRVLTLIFALYVFFTSVQNCIFSLFKGLEQLQHETRISFATNLVALLFLVVFGLAQVPLVAIAILLVMMRVIGLGLALRVTSAVFQKRWFRFTFEGWKETWRKVLIFGTSTLLGILYFQMDTLLLAFWKGDQDVGIYQSVFRISLLTFIILEVAVSALMPALSRFHGESSDRWRRVGYLLYKTLFLIALPITMILFVYAEQIIEILYGGGKFVAAVPVLRLFSIIGFVRFAAEPFGLMLTTGHRQTIRMVICAAAVLLNFSLNTYFIPKLGPLGAAQVSLLTNIVVALAYLAAAKPFVGSWVIDVATLVPLALSIVLSIILWQVRSIPLWYFGLPSVALCLAASYWIGYTSGERRTLFTIKTGLTPSW